MAPGGVNIDRLVEARRYELVTTAQQRNIGQQRETVAAEIERRRQALVEADREVRVLEKLRERQAEQYRRDEEGREAKRLDEVASQQACRNGNGENQMSNDETSSLRHSSFEFRPLPAEEVAR